MIRRGRWKRSRNECRKRREGSRKEETESETHAGKKESTKRQIMKAPRQEKRKIRQKR